MWRRQDTSTTFRMGLLSKLLTHGPASPMHKGLLRLHDWIYRHIAC